MTTENDNPAISEAFKLAKSQCHKYVTVEHLLLASLDCAAEKEQLRFWSVDSIALRSSLNKFLRENVPIQSSPEKGNEPQPTVGFGRVVQRVLKGDKSQTNSSSLLDSIVHEHVHDSIAVKLLQKHGLAIALPQPKHDQTASRIALVNAHVDATQKDLDHVLTTINSCNAPLLRGALNLMADWARFTHLIEDESVRKEKMLQMCNLFECMRVNSIEDRLEDFIAMLERVDDEDRQALAQSLATLVIAPDSKKIKEDCIKGLAGSKVMGYKHKKDRDAARTARDSLRSDVAFEAFRNKRKREMA